MHKCTVYKLSKIEYFLRYLVDEINVNFNKFNFFYCVHKNMILYKKYAV